MAEKDESSGPSLEPPTLFRRKKKSAPPEADPAPVGDDSPTTILDDTPAAASPKPPAPAHKPPASGPEPAAPGPKPPAPPPLFADESPTETLEQQEPLQAPVPAPVAETAAVAGTTPPRPVKPPRTWPVLPARAAAALAGLLAGGLIVGLTSASFELCSWIQGTNSCGGPGIFLLIAILVLAVLLGTAVLRSCEVPEPGSTSFLAVGLTSVVALLFLVDALFSWWMIIVIPLVSVATFLLSHWVTATFVEPAKPVSVIDEPDVVDHDVR